MRHKRPGFWVFVSTILGVLFLLSCLVFPRQRASAAAGINHQINFQGKVTNPNGTNVTNGSYTFVFKLYTVSSGGVATWTETDSLTVTDGVFQVPLGAVTPLPGSVDFNTDNIYLGITFNSDPAGEMSPRIQLMASPYAFNSEKLGGLAASAFVQLSPSGQQTGSVNVSGSGRFDGGLTVASGGTITGNLQIGAAGGTTGALLLNNGGNSNAVTIQAQSGSAAYTINLPSSAPSTSQCLQSGAVTANLFTFGSCGGGGGVTTVGAFSGSSQTNGANITSTTITFGPADASNPGMVSTGSQTWAGDKTFNGNMLFSNTQDHSITVNTASSANGNNLTISAGSGNGTNKTGGNLTLSAGSPTGNGAAGSVIVKPLTDSSTAFLVQNSSGSNLLAADTSNQILNVTNNGSLDAFTTTNTVSTAVIMAGRASANGYTYVLGGIRTNGTSITTVQLAKTNADGTVTWSTLASTPLPVAINSMAAFIANGFLYVIGGETGQATGFVNTVRYSRINADGTLAGWQTGTALPATRTAGGYAYENGYFYIIGGYVGGTVDNSTIYAKANADGSLGAWTAGSTLGTGVASNSVVINNNYIYSFGGYDSGLANHNFTQYATIDPVTGTIGAWSTTTNFHASSWDGVQSVIANGYVYVMGGQNSGTDSRDISYATFNANGTTSAFTTITNALPAARAYGTSFTYNGYLYYVSGTSTNLPANGATTVYYGGTTGRLRLYGSLDLLGGGLGSLTTHSTGGSLTAGNTLIVGTFQVQGAANFGDNLAVQGSLAVQGGANFADGINSTTAFTIQSATGADTLFTADTTNNEIVIGNATGTDTNTTLLVVDSATADPAVGYDGSLYYNTVTNKFRCFQQGAWTDCITNSTITAKNNAEASFTSGLANAAANSSGQVTEMMVFTSATAISNVAGVTGFTAPASGSFRSCLMKNNAAITNGTLSLRWRVNGVSVGAAACNMDATTSRQSATSLDGGVVTFSAGDTLGLAIDTNAAYLPVTNDYTVYWTVEYDASTGNGLSLQYVYDQGSNGVTTSDNRDLSFNLSDTATDSSFVVNMQCATCSASGGRFAVQSGGVDVFNFTPTNGAARFQNTANSTSAFQVQNLAGNSIFGVDTSGGQAILGKASTLSGQVAFNTSAGASTVTLGVGSTSSSYSILLPTAGGSANQCLQLGGGGGSQLQWGACGTNSTGLAKNSADSSSASISAASYLYQFTNSNTAAASGVLKVDNGSNTASAFVVVGTGNSAASNAYFFAKNSNASPSGNLLELQNNVSSGTDLLTVSATGSVAMKTTTNSTTAFQFLNSTGVAALTIDNSSSPNKVQVGASGTDANAILLVVDSYNAADPSGTNGAMYYSTTTNTFRCYENSGWTDCISRHKIVLSGDATDNSGACTITNLTGLSFATKANVAYKFYAVVDYTSAATTTGSNWSATAGNITRLSYVTHSVLSGGVTGYTGGGSGADQGGCSASSVATGANTAVLEGSVITSADDTLQLRFASEINGSAVVAKAGSTLEWWSQ